jgi:hypothetical protein
MINRAAQLLLADPQPYGMSRTIWTEKWWLWLHSIPKPVNPANDTTGEQCARNQVEPNMWFLAGTFGKLVKRTCLVPSNRAILFPIINSVHLLSESLSFKSDSDLEAKVRNEANNVTEMNLTIDGLQLSDLKEYRIHTSAFDIIIPEDNIWGVKPGKTRAAADGYWIFLRPLSHGRHTIEFFGKDLDLFETGVTYELMVRND